MKHKPKKIKTIMQINSATEPVEVTVGDINYSDKTAYVKIDKEIISTYIQGVGGTPSNGFSIQPTITNFDKSIELAAGLDNGIFMSSPNGTRFKITIDNSGAIIATATPL